MDVIILTRKGNGTSSMNVELHVIHGIHFCIALTYVCKHLQFSVEFISP
jgi:hypothetical protein